MTSIEEQTLMSSALVVYMISSLEDDNYYRSGM